jgi:hypothetical protein
VTEPSRTPSSSRVVSCLLPAARRYRVHPHAMAVLPLFPAQLLTSADDVWADKQLPGQKSSRGPGKSGKAAPSSSASQSAPSSSWRDEGAEGALVQLGKLIIGGRRVPTQANGRQGLAKFGVRMEYRWRTPRPSQNRPSAAREKSPSACRADLVRALPSDVADGVLGCRTCSQQQQQQKKVPNARRWRRSYCTAELPSPAARLKTSDRCGQPKPLGGVAEMRAKTLLVRLCELSGSKKGSEGQRRSTSTSEQQRSSPSCTFFRFCTSPAPRERFNQSTPHVAARLLRQSQSGSSILSLR